MAIRKPALSVQEARRLSSARSDAVPPEAAAPASLPPAPAAPHERRQSGPVPAVPDGGQAQDRGRHHAGAGFGVPATVIGARVQVFVSAACPVPGFSPSFDMLSAKYPPAKALQMILRKAMDAYEDRLADGSFASLPESYPAAGDGVVQTSRVMPQELVDLARLHFDPMGFESSRAFGFKLATAALAAFFASERARR